MANEDGALARRLSEALRYSNSCRLGVSTEEQTWADVEALSSHRSPHVKPLYDKALSTLGYSEDALASWVINAVRWGGAVYPEWTFRAGYSPSCLTVSIFFGGLHRMRNFHAERIAAVADQSIPPTATYEPALLALADDWRRTTSALVRDLLDAESIEVLLDGRKALTPDAQVRELRRRLDKTLTESGFCIWCASDAVSAGLDYIERQTDYIAENS